MKRRRAAGGRKATGRRGRAIDPACVLLRELREAAGLGQRELARRMGVGVATVCHVEKGRVPRWLTFQRFLRHLPGASPALFLRGRVAIPPAARRAAGLAAESWLLSARRASASQDARGTVVRVAGARVRLADASAAEQACMRATFMGSTALARSLTPRDLRRRIADGASRHRFERAPGGLNYELVSPDVSPPTWHVAYPVRELRLEAAAPARGFVAHVEVWPSALPEHERGDVALVLHAEGIPISRKGRRFVARVEHPLVGMSYRLRLAPREGQPPARGSSSELRRARERHGLGLRGLALKAGVSHPTVLRAERDGSGLLSSWRRLARVIARFDDPQGTPPLVQACEDMDAWHVQELVFGFSAAEVVKILDVAASGRRRTVVRVKGLEVTAGREGDIVLKVGTERSVMETRSGRLSRLTGPADRVSVRHLEPVPGTDQHVVRVRHSADGRSTSFSRRYDDRERYTLWAERSAGRAPERAGASLIVRYPHRLSALELWFPRGYSPRDVRGHLLPRPLVLGDSWMLRPEVPALPVTLVERGGRLRARVEIERPPVGTKVTLSWELPVA